MLDFLGVGAQKSGTTWLFSQLRKHPQIHFPTQKEVHFWDRQYDRGVEWYKGLFAEEQTNVLQGEITPAYGFLPREKIAEIHTHFPAVKLFYCVRNPIDRAWSSALMALSRAEMEPEEASDAWFIDHFRSKGSRQRGDYLASVKNWLSVYPKAQFLLLDFEEIINDPKKLLACCVDHLGVDGAFFAQMEEDELTQKVYAGQPYVLRKSLLPVLEELYVDKWMEFQEWARQEGLWR